MGGAQERNLRAGTENITGIIGLGKAFELAYSNLERDRESMLAVKQYAIQRLTQTFDDIIFLGNSGDLDKSLFTVLNIGFPNDGSTGLLTFSLDMHKIAASGGSACNSGSNKGSHVIAALGEKFAERVPLRISFSKYTTTAEIDKLIEALKAIRTPVGN